MSAGDEEVDERRGFDRRVYELEHKVERLLMTSALTEERIKGLASTMESRHKAFDRGLDLILDRLKPIDTLDGRMGERLAPIERRLTTLEDLKNKVAGAALLAQVLGVTGVIGGVVAIVKMLKG